MDVGGSEETTGPQPGLPWSCHPGSGPCGASPRSRTARCALLRRSRTLHPYSGGPGSHAAAFGVVPSVTRFRMDTSARPRPGKGDPVPRARPPRRRHAEPPGRARQQARNPGRCSRLDLALSHNLRDVGRCPGSVLDKFCHDNPCNVALGPCRRQHVRCGLRSLRRGAGSPGSC